MAVKDSITAKQADLATAIANAEELINSNASADEQAQALATVKQLQADIKNLQDLPEPTPTPTPATEPEPEDEPIEDDEYEEKKGENRAMPILVGQNSKDNIKEQRDALNAYLHSKGEVRDGLTSVDAGVLIPEEIIYNPDTEIHTIDDLSSLVTKVDVPTASGSYPIMKKPGQTLVSTEELKQNPELANPEFIDVKYDVETYRGIIPISEESIADSQIDLIPLITKWVEDIKLNTSNAKVAAALAKFTNQSVASTDLISKLKSLKNKGFDKAYKLSFVMTQSAYDQLDQAKDSQGRYLLQDSISAESGKALFGKDIRTVDDTAFGGKPDSAQIFIGDLKRSVLFANRLAVTLSWIHNDIYGRVLQPTLRFGVVQADINAGMLINVIPDTSDTPAK